LVLPLVAALPISTFNIPNSSNSSTVSVPTPSPVTSQASDEKFDFDAFLNDLEKKIDQENQQRPAADSATDFRQNVSLPP
jgi:hypothetical protein